LDEILPSPKQPDHGRPYNVPMPGVFLRFTSKEWRGTDLSPVWRWFLDNSVLGIALMVAAGYTTGHLTFEIAFAVSGLPFLVFANPFHISVFTGLLSIASIVLEMLFFQFWFSRKASHIAKAVELALIVFWAKKGEQVLALICASMLIAMVAADAMRGRRATLTPRGVARFVFVFITIVMAAAMLNWVRLAYVFKSGRPVKVLTTDASLNERLGRSSLTLMLRSEGVWYFRVQGQRSSLVPVPDANAFLMRPVRDQVEAIPESVILSITVQEAQTGN